MPNSNPACEVPAGPLSCCNRDVPLQLTASLTNVAGCDALSGVSLTIDLERVVGETATWLGFTNVCGSVLHVRFTCSGPDPNNFTIGPNGWGVYGTHPVKLCKPPFDGPLQPGATCDPINAVFSIIFQIEHTCGCCANNKDVTFDIVITE